MLSSAARLAGRHRAHAAFARQPSRQPCMAALSAGTHSRLLSSSPLSRSAPQPPSSSSSVVTLPWTFPLQIRTPQLKDQQVRKLRLANGLSAIAISDPNSPTAGAALSTEAGSWMDGRHAGTAHFLEHMLFLGTQKYPSENDYERFVLDSNGSLNGYTASDHSMYYFSGITPSALDGALDRFSRFFYEPLFNESCVSREMNAVDEEFRKNMEMDGWRVLHVKKELANQDHPFAMFNTGNLETMKLIDQAYLKEWFKTYYSANSMHLVVQGKEPIDVLVGKIEQAFSPIPNHNLAKLSTVGRRIFPKSLDGQMVWIEPVKNLKELSMSWEIDTKFTQLETKTASLLSHVLGYEGHGSLLSLLREQGLAEGLSAGENTIGADNATFDISISLTERGVAEWRTVLAHVHSAIATLQTRPYPSYILNEVNYMSKVAYEYQQRSSSVSTRYCGILRREGIDTFPNRSYAISDFNAGLIDDLWKSLTPETAVYTMIARDAPVPLDCREKWMGAAYAVFPVDAIAPSLSGAAADAQTTSSAEHSGITYPLPNPFIPDDLKLLTTSASEPKDPVLLLKNEGATLHYYADTEFLVPEASYLFRVKTPMIRPGDARSQCLSSLYMRFVTERLTELGYDASAAGLHYDVHGLQGTGIGFSVEGYSQQSLRLLADVVERLRSPGLNQAEFDIFRATLSRSYHNARRNQPVSQASEMFSYLLYDEACLSSQLAEAADSVTLDELTHFVSRLFESRLIEAFVGGNASEADAHAALALVQNLLPGSPCSADAVRNARVRPFRGDRPLMHTMDVDTKGNAVFWGAYLGPRDDTRRTGQEVLSKLMKEPFFSELRTKQQTGYMVSSGSYQVDKHLFLHASVQSNAYDPRDLLARIELFYEQFQRELSEDATVQARFDTILASTIARLEQPFDRLSAKLRYLNYMTYEEDADYGSLGRRIRHLKQYTLDDLRLFAASALGRSNTSRMAVVATGNSPENVAFGYRSVSVDEIRQ
ncbi:Metalloenzyme, LuxS/M16 peptidase-like protein [Entophlyctis helioformis]|nr:Metalloenzyme, LuxS/M16 peptidase-like protein [Entophlyctis helioformis]